MLNQYVAIYIPGTKNVNQALTHVERARIIDTYAARLSELFGGCTAQDGIGYYKSFDNKLIRERVTIIKAYTDNKDSWKYARAIAESLKIELSQESVTIESQEGIEFI